MTLSKTRSLDDIISYEKQALDLLPKDHPHYDEIKMLLEQQVKEDLEDYANSQPSSNTRAGRVRA